MTKLKKNPNKARNRRLKTRSRVSALRQKNHHCKYPLRITSNNRLLQMEFSSEMAPAFAQAFDEMARDTDNFEVFSDNFYSDEEIIRGIDENI